MTLQHHYGRVLARLLRLRETYAGHLNELGEELLDRCIHACMVEVACPTPEEAR